MKNYVSNWNTLTYTQREIIISVMSMNGMSNQDTLESLMGFYGLSEIELVSNYQGAIEDLSRLPISTEHVELSKTMKDKINAEVQLCVNIHRSS